jgi:hypothetical protein
MLFNQKGQAFSVFKLLIAAVVAVTILMILMSIIGGIDVFSTSDPQDEAIKKLGNGLQSLGTPLKVKSVTFSPDYTLSGTTMSNSLDIGPDQLCVCLSERYDGGTSRFDASAEGIIVNYTGASNQVTGLRVLCNNASVFEGQLARLSNIVQDEINYCLEMQCSSDFSDILSSGGNARICVLAVVDEG